MNLFSIVVEVFELLIPLGICVVLPILIVWIVLRQKKFAMEKKAEVITKAFELGVPIDQQIFEEIKTPLKKSCKSRLISILIPALVLLGLGFATVVTTFIYTVVAVNHKAGEFFVLYLIAAGVMFIGAALLAVFFIAKKLYAKDIEAENMEIEAKMAAKETDTKEVTE